MHRNLGKNDYERKGNELVESACRFIDEYPRFFRNPVDLEALDALPFGHSVFLRSKRIRTELNDFVNSIHELGGDIPLLTAKISELIRLFDLVVHGNTISMHLSKMPVFECAERIWSLSDGISLAVTNVMRLQYSAADVIFSGSRDGDTCVNGDVPVEISRVRKVYDVLSLMFKVRGDLADVTHEGGGHRGWVLLNMDMETFGRMDYGHALGRVWDAYEIDDLVRRKTKESTVNYPGASSLTLISNIVSDRQSGFSRPEVDLLGLDVSDILEVVGDKIVATISGEFCEKSLFVAGGCKGLSPMKYLSKRDIDNSCV